jgi:phosphoribosylformylglycinamidine cyclo-ligase
MDREPLTYAQAGVDVEAGDKAVAMMRAAVEATQGPRVLGGIGGFAGLWRLAGDLGRAGVPADPVLAAASDGVGTKLLVAQAMGRHDTVGIDLVAMVVDDLVVVGARPLFLLDYIAIGRVDPDLVAALVGGVAKGCELARCALLGGETAEHPDAMEPGHYDLAGFGVGVVERDRLLGPERVRAGDVLVGLDSSGLHSNGYSLVRHVLLGAPSEGGAGWALDRHVDELGRTLGEELLEPTTVYAKACLDLARRTRTHAMSHITGGGLAANLERVLPDTVVARIDRGTWTPQPVFDLVRRVGSVAHEDLERTLNCGVGMVALVDPADADTAVRLLEGHGVRAWMCGEVVAAGADAPERTAATTGHAAAGSATLHGSHPGW